MKPSRHRDERWLTASEVQRLIAELDGRTLSRGMLQHYTQNAYVRPRLVTGFGQRGRPSSVGYTLTDVILLRWLLRLSAEGIALKQFAQGIAALRDLMPQALEAPEDLRFYVVNKKHIAVMTRDDGQVQLTGSVGQVLLTFAVPLIAETVRRAEKIIDARSGETAGAARGGGR